MTQETETPINTFDDFYRGKSVLVTGHTGFKGSWLALWLNELGASVTGLALKPETDPSHFKLIGLGKSIQHIEGDIRNINDIKRVFSIAKPDIVFHLAAQALVRDSYSDPKTTFDTNVGGTINVLESIRNSTTVQAAVIVTSDKCYENKEWVWGYRETDPLGGYDPYSASKGATEIVCSAYHRSYFDKNGEGPHLGLATVRAGNVIGGGDWARDRIIPDCVRALSNHEPIMVRNPHATRPWQHVLDPLYGYLLLGMRLSENPERYGGAWNFGPRTSNQVTVRELVERFVRAWGNGAIHAPAAKSGLHEARLLNLNIDKAVLKLKWQPVLDSSTAIDWTVNWYKSWHQTGGNCIDLSVRQINEFADLAAMKGMFSS
ncbi:MAG: CDP-glucose 4,6-dehydratase [Smithella sp.]